MCYIPKLGISLRRSEEIPLAYRFYKHFVPQGLRTGPTKEDSFIQRTSETGH